jgi:hypothetical protein
VTVFHVQNTNVINSNLATTACYFVTLSRMAPYTLVRVYQYFVGTAASVFKAEAVIIERKARLLRTAVSAHSHNPAFAFI